MALVDFENDAWLAGFADGEASFNINRKYGRNGKLLGDGDRYYPHFGLALRADDASVLCDLAEAFGGKVKIRYANKPDLREGRNPERTPRAEWTICSKADLARLADYFRRFPCRAKKARDCAIWLLAVEAWLRDGARATELGPLREALHTGRRYDAEVVRLAEHPRLVVASGAR